MDLPGGTSASVTIAGVHPLLAFAKNGRPMVAAAGDAGYAATGVAGAVVDNDGGPLAVLLPRDGMYLDDPVFLGGVTRVDLDVRVPADLHTGAVFGDLAARSIALGGEGLRNPGTRTVGRLEGRADLMLTQDYGGTPAVAGCGSCHEIGELPLPDHDGVAASPWACLGCHLLDDLQSIHGAALRDVSFGASGVFHGVDLLQLLEHASVGLAVDAGAVTVTGADGTAVSFTVADLEAADAPVLLAFSRAGVPLVEDESSAGYDAVAGNAGGPIELVSRRYVVRDVVSVSVSLQAGVWTHAAAPYSAYLPRALTVSGSEADGTTILSLADLEAHSSLRDSFAASKGVSAYQGLTLRGLVVGHLAQGMTTPTRVRVFGADGYSVELPVADVLDGIDSTYQPGQHRDVLLAYAKDGCPLVASDASEGYVPDAFNDAGPLHLIVENTISAWVKDVRAIVLGEGDPVFARDRVAATAVRLVSPTACQARASVARGATLRLRAVLTPTDSTDALAWSSSAPRRAEVSPSGVVTAARHGEVRIFVRASSGKTDAITLTVKRRQKAAAVALPPRKTLSPGSAARLVARLSPEGATSLLSWRSSDRTVATVDAAGRVLAVRRGTATITVRTDDGRRAAFVVVVRRG